VGWPCTRLDVTKLCSGTPQPDLAELAGHGVNLLQTSAPTTRAKLDSFPAFWLWRPVDSPHQSRGVLTSATNRRHFRPIEKHDLLGASLAKHGQVFDERIDKYIGNLPSHWNLLMPAGPCSISGRERAKCVRLFPHAAIEEPTPSSK